MNETNDNGSSREHWSGSLGFVLAAAGSAIGLGNIWKFPYITGENGGGAFILIYLVCIAIIGIPVMICEITLGRKTQRNPVGAFKMLQPKTSMLAHIFGFCTLLIGISLLLFANYGWGVVMLILGGVIFIFGWTVVGIIGVLAGFIILSYYSVVAGWTFGYIVKGLGGNLAFETKDAAGTGFVSFITNIKYSLACHIFFMASCVAIVIFGVKKGIERCAMILMPLLFLLLIVLILRSITLEGSQAGISFLLSPNFSKLSAKGIMEALGHAFFTLSLGMGAMITYGSYLSKKENIFISTLSIVGLDTLIALMAGLAIFPAVFAYGFDPSDGPGLIFNVLPVIFNKMPLGSLWVVIFFVLLLVAALTSGISLLEVVVAFFIDEMKLKRIPATLLTGFVITLLGCFSVCSVTSWENIPGVESVLKTCFRITETNFLDAMDHLSSRWLLPLGGLFISLFVGWIWGTRKAVEEIREGSHNFADVHLIALLAGLKDDPSHNSDKHVLTLASIWGIFIRFISPIAVMIAFLYTIGLIKL